MNERTLFLIVSNPRTGSTWLQTSLGDLPDVAVDYELKWGLRADQVRGVQRAIPDGRARCKAILADISDDAPVIGSKITMSGEIFPLEEAAELIGTIDSDIRVLHLTRPYFDILMSARGHGAFHMLKETSGSIKNAAMIQNLREDSEPKRPASSVKSNQRIVDDPLWYGLLARIHHRLRLGGPVALLPYDDIINMLLAFFLNDLVLLQARRHVHNWLHIRYDEIRNRFLELARFIGSNTDTTRTETIMSSPITQKLQGLREDLFVNHVAIREVASTLDRACENAIGRANAVSDFWEWDRTSGTALIHVNGLARAVDAGRPFWRRRYHGIDTPLRWRLSGHDRHGGLQRAAPGG